MGWGLKEAVGLTNEDAQCSNLAVDQQQVGELLDAFGLVAGGTPLDVLPPIGEGHASPELYEAIRRFQSIQDGLVADSRVDVNGAIGDASIVAALIAVTTVGLLLFPVVEWTASVEISFGLGAGVQQLLLRLGALP